MSSIRKSLEQYWSKHIIPLGMVVTKTDRWGSIEEMKVVAIFQNMVTAFIVQGLEEAPSYQSMHPNKTIYRIVRSTSFDILCEDEVSKMHYKWSNSLTVVNCIDFFEKIIKRLEKNAKVVDEFTGFNLVLDYNPKMTNFMLVEGIKEINDIEDLLTNEAEYVKIAPSQLEDVKELFKTNLRHYKVWGEK